MKRSSYDARFQTRCHAILLEDLAIACIEIAKQIPSPHQEHFDALGQAANKRATDMRKWSDEYWRYG